VAGLATMGGGRKAAKRAITSWVLLILIAIRVRVPTLTKPTLLPPATVP
jgi:hypothetical protein